MNWYVYAKFNTVPSMKARDFKRFLSKQGFAFKRQNGSHEVWVHEDGRSVIIPNHSGDMNKGLIAGIVTRILGMSLPQFQMALRS